VDKPLGFVALSSIKQEPPDAKTAIAQIREIYFKTTKRTIEHDIAHAIELLKSLPSEEERHKAAVYMDGLAQMRSEWAEKKGTADKAQRTGKGRRRNRPNKRR
jgi:hypothetical protein